MKRSFDKNIEALNDVFEFTSEFVDSHNIDETAAFAATLAIEELFTNIVKYSGGGGEKLSILMNITGKKLVIQLTDFDVERFDLTRVKHVDVTKDLEERAVGGIGLHLVRNMVDKITYEYKDRVACITLIKQLEETNV